MRMATQIMKEAETIMMGKIRIMKKKVVMLVLLLSMKKMRISRAQRILVFHFYVFDKLFVS